MEMKESINRSQLVATGWGGGGQLYRSCLSVFMTVFVYTLTSQLSPMQLLLRVS